MAVFNINRHVVEGSRIEKDEGNCFYLEDGRVIEGSMYNNPNVIITWDDAIYVDDED